MHHFRHSVLDTPYSVLLCSLLICGSLWPATRWVEFSSGSEQLVVAAALESSREGEWIVPQMAGEPRLRKPPPATWLAMATTSAEEAKQLADGPVDEVAFRSLAGRMRAVSLLLGVVTLVLTFELGRLVAGREVGWLSLAVCGSTFFVAEQFSRITTDALLATTVVATNVAIGHAVLRGRLWSGLSVAGLLLGASFLAKGPVGLLMTVLPVALWLAFRKSLDAILERERAGLHDGQNPLAHARGSRGSPRSVVSGAVAGSIGFVCIALPWFVYVLQIEPGAWSTWTTEIARTDETVPKSDPFAYLVFPLLAMPWSIFVVLGLLTAAAEMVRRLVHPRWLRRNRTFGRVRPTGLLWVFLMILVPIVVMSLFRDRKDRYLLPLIPPAAILAAMALKMVVADLQRRPIAARLAIGGHWLILLVLVVGLPITMGLLPRDEYVDATGWLPWKLAIPAAMVGGIFWFAWLRVGGGHKWLIPARIVTATVFLFLYTANLFLAGYSTSREAKTDLLPIARAIRQDAPDARVWHGERYVPPGLLIYSGRVILPLPDELDETKRHVYVVRQRRVDEDPEPTMPEPWRVLRTARRDRSVWWAFVRDPLR